MSVATASKSLIMAAALLSALGAFAATKASLELTSPATISGIVLEPGDYRLEWNGNGPAVEVKVLRGTDVKAKVRAELVDLPTAANTSFVVFDTEKGSSTIAQIRFNGKKYALKILQPAVVVPVAVAPDNLGRLLLKEGSEVKLRFADTLSSKTATEGDPVNLVLDEPLKVGDVVLVRDGAIAVATVTNAKKSGMMGRPGELNIRLEHLKAGDGRVRLRGSKGKEGEGREGDAVLLTVLFGPIGLIKHGKNVDVKAGTPLTAYVDQDTLLYPAQ